jgi:uncharacterized protein (TIGR00725 family)
MPLRTVIGVMGSGHADEATAASARELGRLIAENGWVLLNGGRDAGVMAASAAGAHEAGGLVIGILPGDDTTCVAPDVDIAIPTGLGDARNVVNVLASDVVVACAGNAGTLSEVAHALKAGKPVVTLALELGTPFERYRRCGQLVSASTPGEAIAAVRRFLGRGAQ